MTEKELKHLLEDMTLEEKLGELWQPMNRTFDENGVLTGNDVKMNNSRRDVELCGSTLNLFGFDKLKQLQDEHIKHHPHRIPMMFMGDIIHGFATVFPQPLAASCSFDTELEEKCYAAIAKEASVAGINVTYFPMMDLVRDPRWGRVMESAGEDPYLASRFCAAIVKGLQGDGIDKKYTMAACIKHFAGYGGAEGGRDYNSVEISERGLRQYYLPGYKGGIDAGAKMVMTSYNTVGGVPSTCNKWLLRDVLRGEWGFDGVVITDLFAMSSMYSGHRVGETERDAAEMSVKAGIDIEMGGKMYKNLAESVRLGTIDEKLIDDAVWRCLKLKNDMGLFENPYRCLNEEESKSIFKCGEHLALALKMAEESCVLLKNNDNILPLNPDGGTTAFIGPFTEHTGMLSTWDLSSGGTEKGNTLRNEIMRRYPGGKFEFAIGCTALGREQSREAGYFGNIDEDNREKTISEAVEIARKSDRVVLTLGELVEQSGEAASRSDIRIPDVQLELYRRVREVNSNVAVIVYTGRPLDLSAIGDAKAIMVVWHLGTTENSAITNLLFGKAIPSGKLTMSFPRSVGQIPVYYNHLPTDHRTEPYWSEYRDNCSSEPLYPFGYGLSYTEFEYGSPEISNSVMKKGETVIVSAVVTNKGQYDAYETVQLYLRDVRATVSRPAVELKGFKRVFIKSSEQETVSFEIDEESLKYYNINMDYVADPGEFIAYISPNSCIKEENGVSFFLD